MGDNNVETSYIPEWANYIESTRTITGTPIKEDVDAKFEIFITAVDPMGLDATTSF